MSKGVQMMIRGNMPSAHKPRSHASTRLIMYTVLKLNSFLKMFPKTACALACTHKNDKKAKKKKSYLSNPDLVPQLLFKRIQ